MAQLPPKLLTNCLTESVDAIDTNSFSRNCYALFVVAAGSSFGHLGSHANSPVPFVYWIDTCALS